MDTREASGAGVDYMKSGHERYGPGSVRHEKCRPEATNRNNMNKNLSELHLHENVNITVIGTFPHICIAPRGEVFEPISVPRRSSKCEEAKVVSKQVIYM